MRALQNFLRRNERGALVRLAEQLQVNPSTLHRWARGVWSVTPERRREVIEAMATVKVFAAQRQKKPRDGKKIPA